MSESNQVIHYEIHRLSNRYKNKGSLLKLPLFQYLSLNKIIYYNP